MKKLQYCLAIILFIFPTSCKKYEFPDITSEGNNTFGWKVDGGKRAYKYDFFIRSRRMNFRYELINPYPYPIFSAYPVFSLYADDNNYSKGWSDHVSISGDSVFFTGVKTYKIDKYNTKGSVGARYSSVNLDKNIWNEYETTSLSSGDLTVTKYDSVTKIVSGTFFFDAYAKDGRKVEIREGRFDIHFD